MRAFVKIIAVALALIVSWGSVIHSQAISRLLADPGVTRVLNDRQYALQESLRIVNGHRRFNDLRYNRLLQHIGANDCPTAFRLAWLDYQHAWTQHLKQRREKPYALATDVVMAVLGGVLAGRLSGAAPMVEPAASDLKRPVLDTEPAWWKVKRQAIISRCKIPARTFNI